MPNLHPYRQFLTNVCQASANKKQFTYWEVNSVSTAHLVLSNQKCDVTRSREEYNNICCCRQMPSTAVTKLSVFNVWATIFKTIMCWSWKDKHYTWSLHRPKGVTTKQNKTKTISLLISAELGTTYLVLHPAIKKNNITSSFSALE